MPDFAVPSSDIAEFARDVLEHLSRTPQRELPSQYFYDAVGTKLFEAITELEEYGLTRADSRLLSTHAADTAIAAGRPCLVAELGSGTGQKTRRLLEQLPAATYCPIDLSSTALAACAAKLGDAVRLEPVCASYLPGLGQVASRRRAGETLLVLFLGSTIGNFNHHAAGEFLRAVRERLLPDDSLLLGTDLVKPVETLLLAYDDPAGVTAAFNLNLLARVNRELGGDFNLRKFRHEARWRESESRIEMHAVSMARQKVRIAGIDLSFVIEEGETIWTESSHKYRLEDLDELARVSGFDVARQWVDQEWPFAETLMRVPKGGVMP